MTLLFTLVYMFLLWVIFCILWMRFQVSILLTILPIASPCSALSFVAPCPLPLSVFLHLANKCNVSSHHHSNARVVWDRISFLLHSWESPSIAYILLWSTFHLCVLDNVCCQLLQLMLLTPVFPRHFLGVNTFLVGMMQLALFIREVFSGI